MNMWRDYRHQAEIFRHVGRYIVFNPFFFFCCGVQYMASLSMDLFYLNMAVVISYSDGLIDFVRLLLIEI